jgi:hypothetical protein
MVKDSKEGWKSAHENDGLTKYGGRDVMGYASRPPKVQWPKGAKVALNFVINYEEGGEKCLLHGDKESEKLLSDDMSAQAQRKSPKMDILSFFRTNNGPYLTPFG